MRGAHSIKDIFEQLEDLHFLYEEKTVEALLKTVNAIDKPTKKAILEALDQEFESDY